MVTFFRGIPRPLRHVLNLWLVLGIAVSVRTYLKPASHTNFPVYAGGSVHWWNDEPVYASYAQFDLFRYSPLFAIVVTPFEKLGLRAGGILWHWFNLVVAGWGAWHFVRDVLPATWRPWRKALFLVTVTVGAISNLWNGQSNLLAVGLVLLGVAALVRGTHWWSALWLASSILVKLTPIPIVLLLSALWPRQLLPRLACMLGLGLAIPFLTRPPEQVLIQYRDMVKQCQSTSGQRWAAFRDAWTVRLVVQAYRTGEPVDLKASLHSQLYRVIQVSAACVALIWCLMWQRRGERSDTLALCALGSGAAWLVLFGPAVEPPTYIFLVPALAWGLVQSSSRAARILIASSAALILVLRKLTVPWVPDFPPLLLILPLGAALFVGWLIIYGISEFRIGRQSNRELLPIECR